MKSVLGIDAAWTEKNASGVAVAVENADGWTLKGAWPSVGSVRANAPCWRNGSDRLGQGDAQT